MRHWLKAGVLGLALAGAIAPQAWALPAVEDHLPAFLVTVGEGTGEAWMAYESAYSRSLDQLFYQDRTASQKLALIRQAIGQGVPVAQVRTFTQRWRADFDLVAARMEQAYGPLSGLKVSAWYCADPRLSVVGALDGQPTLALNVRPMLPYDPSRVRVLLAQELFRYYANRGLGANPEPMTLSRRLQFEGLALAAMEKAVPGLAPHQYLQIPPATYKAFERNQKTIARGLKHALERPESANAMARFFGAGFGDPWPAGSGRYVAYWLAKHTVRDRGPLELNVLPSRDYLFLTQTALDDMAKVTEGVTP